MNKAVNDQLIDNISQLLKRALVADEFLTELRHNKQAGFSAIFPKNAGFTSSGNTFQPYIEEVSNQLLAWQTNQDEELLLSLVQKIQKLFQVLAQFEANYETKSQAAPSSSAKH